MEIKPEEGKNYTNYVEVVCIVAIIAIIVLGIWTVFRRTPPEEKAGNAFRPEVNEKQNEVKIIFDSLFKRFENSGHPFTEEVKALRRAYDKGSFDSAIKEDKDLAFS